ncbi:sugar phosphate nucleotidyltransferase, partial [Microbacteriaceae bacterium K1510]|nr:sugar phosphate nucleotidyltransferase [Microbacteriaceae bacterium K1510]
GKLVEFHRAHGRLATVTAVKPPGRFGALEIGTASDVLAFREKPTDELGWINGGFFVLEPKVLDYVGGDDSVWERTPLERLSNDNQLVAYRHHGF